ncbi:MAG: DUF1990 domain-containing protein [Myxococcota bacterium]
MIGPARPSDAAIAARLADERVPASYVEVGATADPRALERLGSRYTVDRHRFPVGRGRAVFERAGAALFAWRHFEIPWLALHGADAPVRPGQIVATRTRVFGLWFVNPCRVVYVEPDEGAGERVAYAYGTLEGHVARGEERFVVERDPSSDVVTFEIVAFSRPATVLTRLGRFWMRRIQQRFGRDASAALARAIATPDETPRVDRRERSREGERA